MVALEDFLTFSGARYVVDLRRLEKCAPSMLLSFCLVLYMLGTGHLCCERCIWQLLVLCLGFLGRVSKLRRMEKCAHLSLQLLVYASYCSHLESGHHFNEPFIVPGSYQYECGRECFLCALCAIFRTPSTRTLSPTGADADSHPRCWASRSRGQCTGTGPLDSSSVDGVAP